VLAGSAVMQRVAETLSERGLSEARMTSIERRLARFIGNSRIVVPLITKKSQQKHIPEPPGWES
jgi:hypothetical protein